VPLLIALNFPSGHSNNREVHPAACAKIAITALGMSPEHKPYGKSSRLDPAVREQNNLGLLLHSTQCTSGHDP